MGSWFITLIPKPLIKQLYEVEIKLLDVPEGTEGIGEIVGSGFYSEEAEKALGAPYDQPTVYVIADEAQEDAAWTTRNRLRRMEFLCWHVLRASPCPDPLRDPDNIRRVHDASIPFCYVWEYFP